MSDNVVLHLALRGGQTQDVRVRASAASRLVKALAEPSDAFVVDLSGVMVRLSAVDAVTCADDDWRDRVLEAANAVPTL